MAFDVGSWKQAVAERVRYVRSLARDAGATAYGALCGMTLWPAVEAASKGDALPVGMALMAVAGSVGSNLVAGHLQQWAVQQTSEADIAAWAGQAAAQDHKLRDELDAILSKLDSIGQAQQTLAAAPSERDTFLAALREELRVLGNLPRFEAALGGASIAIEGDVTNSVIVAGKANRVTVVQRSDRRAGKDAAAALKLYLERLWRDNGPLPLRGIDPKASDPTSGEGVRLAEVYVGLDTTTQVEVEADKPTPRGRPGRAARREAQSKQRPLAALEATLRERRVVLLGEPGAGKSTFLNFVTLCLAGHGLRPGDGWLDRLPGWGETTTLPIPVVLRDFARALPEDVKKPGAKHMWDFVAARLADARLAEAAPALERALEDGRAVVFFDGLDEVPSDAQRATVRAALTAFAERYLRSRFVVTCRTLSYQDRAWQLAGWPTFTLAPFDGEKIRGFIDAWYAELTRLAVVNEATGRALAEALSLAVQRTGLAALAPNPLLLTQMALVHTHEGRLPDARAQLYEKTVDLLLWRWEDVKRQDDGSRPGLRALLDEAGARDMDLLVALRRVAFEVHQARGGDGPAVADIPESRPPDIGVRKPA